jgi:hypothetical protein
MRVCRSNKLGTQGVKAIVAQLHHLPKLKMLKLGCVLARRASIGSCSRARGPRTAHRPPPLPACSFRSASFPPRPLAVRVCRSNKLGTQGVKAIVARLHYLPKLKTLNLGCALARGALARGALWLAAALALAVR